MQLGLAVAHGGGLRHHYILAVVHSHALRHGYVGKISRQNGVAGTHTYLRRTEVPCATAMWGKVGAKKVHRVPHLSVAQRLYPAPRIFCYPWRTYFRCATPKCAQAGRPGTSLAVAQDQKTCATGKLICVAQCNRLRHVYLAMAH